jgi:hypothetical protein
MTSGVHKLFTGVGCLDTLGEACHFVPAPWQYL